MQIRMEANSHTVHSFNPTNCQDHLVEIKTWAVNTIARLHHIEGYKGITNLTMDYPLTAISWQQNLESQPQKRKNTFKQMSYERGVFGSI